MEQNNLDHLITVYHVPKISTWIVAVDLEGWQLTRIRPFMKGEIQPEKGLIYFDIEYFQDGWYELQQPIISSPGRFTKVRRYVQIEDGMILDECQGYGHAGAWELIERLDPLSNHIGDRDLPDLAGKSAKQVSFAEDIRELAIRAGWRCNWTPEESRASYWLDQREMETLPGQAGLWLKPGET